MAVNRSTYLEDQVDAAVRRIGDRNKWSISQTIAELVNESESLKRELRQSTTKKRQEKTESAA